MRIKLNLDAFNSAQQEKGWSDTELAQKMNVSTTQLWRVRLAEFDARHNDPGKNFIAGALTALDKKFEELFFLDLRSSNRHPMRGKVSAHRRHPPAEARSRRSAKACRRQDLEQPT
jgi:transcriptional regulator with XRE-family HTH domain